MMSGDEKGRVNGMTRIIKGGGEVKTRKPTTNEYHKGK